MYAWGEHAATARPLVMGVLNVTPDSFSDGGQWLAPESAARHGISLVDEGADIIDVGGESTRPGASRVDADTERARVVPVVAALAAATDRAISIDTTKAAVAGAAIDAGATIVNDISAARFDPDILRVAAAREAAYIVMHMQGEPRTMQTHPRYDDVVREVGDFLVERLDVARAAGIADDRLAADPGIGFGKTIAHNLALLRALPEIAMRVEVPLVLGASRKSFLLTILGNADASTTARDDATLATTVWAAQRGVAVLRVHDVRTTARTLQLLDVLRRATPDGIAA